MLAGPVGAGCHSGAMTVSAHWWDDSSWVGAIGQWAGAGTTFLAVVTALWLAHADRRARAVAQAGFVTVTVHYRDYTPLGGRKPRRLWPWVEITNHSEAPVRRPRIKSLGKPNPPVGLLPVGEEYPLTEVLPPGATHTVVFCHCTDGKPNVFDVDEIAKPVDVADVKIAFTNGSGSWRRTGNGKPVRERWWHRLRDWWSPGVPTSPLPNED